MRKLSALAAITSAAAIAAVGLAGTASAYDGETAKGIITIPQRSAYARPSTTSEVLDQLGRNEDVDVLCIAFGSSITRDPFDDPVWFKVGQSGTEVGYVHRSVDGALPRPTRRAAGTANTPMPSPWSLFPEAPERTGNPVNHTEG